MKRILVTSFEPFDNRSTNQSYIVGSSLHHVVHLSLPVVYQQAFKILSTYLYNHTFDMMISLGEAPISKLQLEYVALNIMHARIPDNAGFQPMHQKIDDNGQAILESSLPLSLIEKHLSARALPYQVSYHAGTYVCNDLFYRFMQAPFTIPRGFIHVPTDVNHTPQTIMTMQYLVNFLQQGEKDVK